MVELTALAVGRVGGVESLLAAFGDGTIRRGYAGSFAPHDLVFRMPEGWASTVHADDHRVYASGPEGLLVAWDMVTGEPVFECGGTETLVLGHSRGAPALFVSWGDRISVVDPTTGNTVREFDLRARWGEPYYDNAGHAFVDDTQGHDSPVRTLAYGRLGDQDHLATSDGDTQYLREAGDGSVGTWLRGDFGLVGNALAIGRYGNRDVVANTHQNGDVWLHDPTTGERLGDPLTGPTDEVTALVLHRGTLAAAVEDVVLVWTPDGQVRTVTLPGPAVALVAATHLYAAYAGGVHIVDPCG